MNSTIKLVAVFLSASIISGCAGMANLPSLQGGDVYFKKNQNENEEEALKELSKIDLIYELDPQKKGSCHSQGGIEELTVFARISCAIDGFNNFEYYDQLPSNRKESFKVNNVTVAYAQNQTNRLNKLAAQYNDESRNAKDYYSGFVDMVRTSVIDKQRENFIERMDAADKNSAYLEYLRVRRNEVQALILTSSDAACDLYKRRLNGLFSNSNFGFGTLATTAGGLGAIFTNADAARALSGVAGITSGVRAEWNDAYFRNQVVEVLTKAIDIAKKKKRDEIQRRSVQITYDYNMQQAINDAIDYNSKCTLIAGLQETSESLQTVSDPGLKWLATAFGGAASNKGLTSTLFESLGKAVIQVQQIQKTTEDPNAVTDVPEEEEPK